MQSCKWDAKNLHSDFEATTKDWPIKRKWKPRQNFSQGVIDLH
jgi:hypothetical protein